MSMLASVKKLWEQLNADPETQRTAAFVYGASKGIDAAVEIAEAAFGISQEHAELLEAGAWEAVLKQMKEMREGKRA